jgi:hypothetical protein
MRRQEKLFLDKYDFTRVFEKHNVEYINITEEIWAKRIEDPESVRETIKNESDPFLREKIFGFMPTKLAKLKGNTLISLGRVKGYGGNYPSLSIKNLFGLIPDPMRSWWHGSDNCDLSQNIIDVTRLYNAYFKLFGICEAIENFTVNDPRGEVKAPFGVYRVQPGKGFLACSANLVELDAILCCLMNIDPEKVGYIQNGGVLGKYDKSVLEKASSSSPLFLNPNERKMN